MATATGQTLPPAIHPPAKPPGLRASLRAVRTAIDGWPAGIFAGGVYRARYPGSPLIVSEPALATEILVERADEFPHGELFDRLFRPVWGRGIFVSEGAEWRWQRRAAAPAFRPAQMHALAPVMARSAAAVVAQWRAGVPVDLHQEMRRLTLQLLFDALLSGGADFPDKAETSRHVQAFLDRVGQFRLADFLPMPDRWRGSTAGRGAAHAAYLRAGIDAMIARRRSEAEPGSDLVALLMAAEDPDTGQRMDDALLRDNLLGFIAAGTDTSSFALAWALWLVAHHPEVEARLLAEIADVAGDAPISPKHVGRLRYTHQIIRETQRLYPGAVALARTAAHGCVLGGRTVRRGTLIQVATYALHRRPDLWAHPERFDPDRFADEAPRPLPGAYHPFGAGPRTCIGAAFAMTEMIVALATLARTVRLVGDPARPVRLGVRLGALVSQGGMWMIPALRNAALAM
jgi:cytochrome P450